MTNVPNIYDSLFEYESNKNISFPVHKKLVLKEGNILDLIFSKVSFRKNDLVLDAGCGNGHTLFKLNEIFGCKGLGVSLSNKEIDFAKSMAIEADLSERIDFEQISYDADFPEKFEKVIAIESIKHSSDLSVTIDNLWNHLKDDGYLIIADDFLLNNKKYLNKQAKCWNSPGFVSLKKFVTVLKKDADIKEEQIQNINLTSFVPVRNKWVLKLIIGLVNSVISFSPKEKSTNLRTYLGGLLLELGYVNKDVSYSLLILHKK